MWQATPRTQEREVGLKGKVTKTIILAEYANGAEDSKINMAHNIFFPFYIGKCILYSLRREILCFCAGGL